MSVEYICRIKPGVPMIDPVNVARLQKARREAILRQRQSRQDPAIETVSATNLGPLRSVPTGGSTPIIDWPSKPGIEIEFKVAFGENGYNVSKKARIDFDQIDEILGRLQEIREHPSRDNIFIVDGRLCLNGIFREAVTEAPSSNEELVNMLVNARGGLITEGDCSSRFFNLIKNMKEEANSPAEYISLLIELFNYLTNREVSFKDGYRTLSMELICELSDVEGVDLELFDQLLLAFYMDQPPIDRGLNDALIIALLPSQTFRNLFKQRANELKSADPRTVEKAQAWMEVLGFIGKT